MSHRLLHLILLVQACLVMSQTPSFTTDPQSQTILNHGTATTLTCSASPVTSYTWRKDGVMLSNSSIFTVISDTLKIPSFNPAQDGEYRCLASNSASMTTITSAVANMRTSTFSIAAAIGTEVMVDMNGAVQLPCGAVTAHPQSQVTYAWAYQKFGYQSATPSSPNRPIVGDDGTLYIRDATESTTYRCTASFGVLYTPLQYFVNLTVSGTAASPPASTVLYGPTDLTVSQGDNAVLECIGVVEGTYTWLLPASLTAIERVQPAGTKLTLFQVDSTFEGTYTCTVVTTSPDFTSTSSATLTVIVPPTMTTTLGPATGVNFGTALSLQCTASGRGITWRWYHNGEPISSTDTHSSDESSSSYMVAATTKANAGAYQCFAYNSAGNAKDATTVTINIVPPMIITPLVEDVAFLGGSITMTCAASGFPPPTFTWAKEGIPITVDDDGSDGVLTLTGVGPLFPGMYTCTATSMIPGDPEVIPPATSSAEFFAAAPTVFTTTLPVALTVSTGKGFVLQCAVTHSPDTTVELTWSRDDVVLTNGGNVNLVSSSDATSLSLELNLVQTVLDDAGMYTCSAETTYTAGGKSIATTPIAPISTPVTITDDPIVPKITVTVVDPRTISISWLYTGVISDITGYEVEYRARGANYTRMERSLDSITKVTVSGLRTFTQYSVRVAVVHVSDRSRSYSDVTVVSTPQTAPTGAPLGLSATIPRDQNTSLFVNWRHPHEPLRNGIITGYTIRYWPNITREEGVPLFKFEIRLTNNGTSTLLTRLMTETVYFLEIAANTSVGMGPYSEVINSSTLLREPILPQIQFYETIWFIALCVLLIVSCLLCCGCALIIMNCRRKIKRKSGKFSVRHSGYFDPQPIFDNQYSMTQDVVADYDNRKKDFPSQAFIEGVDTAGSETSMSTAGTKFTYPPSNASFPINQQRMPPPSYIEPPSFEATLRARSASMSTLEKHMITTAVLPQPLTSSHTYIPAGLEDKNSRDSDDSGHHSSHSPDFATFV